ncbi:unnamed protein product [Pedinophyceae sp. YPF-701]|nr:unnamed protein product [Pedinophyceae sp. YPF-701]
MSTMAEAIQNIDAFQRATVLGLVLGFSRPGTSAKDVEHAVASQNLSSMLIASNQTAHQTAACSAAALALGGDPRQLTALFSALATQFSERCGENDRHLAQAAWASLEASALAAGDAARAVLVSQCIPPGLGIRKDPCMLLLKARALLAGDGEAGPRLRAAIEAADAAVATIESSSMGLNEEGGPVLPLLAGAQLGGGRRAAHLRAIEARAHMYAGVGMAALASDAGTPKERCRGLRSKALDRLMRAQDLDSSNLHIMHNRAQILAEERNFEGCVQGCRAVLGPSLAAAGATWVLLANALTASGRHEEALRVAQAGLPHGGPSAHRLLLLIVARLQLMLLQHNDAIDTLGELVASSHGEVSAVQEQRDVPEASGKSGGTASSLMLGLLVWIEMAGAFLALGKTPDARYCAERALKAGPEEPGAHHAMGCVLLAEGDSGAALARWQSALVLDPHHRASALSVAEAHVRLCREEVSEEGLTASSKARRKTVAHLPSFSAAGPGSLTVRINGDALAPVGAATSAKDLSGRLVVAEQLLRNLLADDEGDWRAWLVLAQVLKISGRAEEARRALEIGAAAEACEPILPFSMLPRPL